MNKEEQLIEQFSKRIARVVEELIKKRVHEAKRRKFSKVEPIPASIIAVPPPGAAPTAEFEIAKDEFSDCGRDLG